MSLHDRERVRFHNWLLAHDLDEEVADAILAAMPPYDWHEIATKSDIATLDRRFDRLEHRLEHRLDSELGAVRSEMRDGFASLRLEMIGLRREMRIVLLALVGFMVSVVLSVLTTAVATGITP